MPSGTVIGDVDVGGLAPDVARAAVERHAARVRERGVSITLDGVSAQPIHVSGRELGARPLVDAAFEDAGDRGALSSALDRVGIHRTRQVPLRFALAPGRVEALVARVRREAGSPPRAATVVVAAGGLRVRAGARGVGFDEDALRSRLTELPASITLDAHEVAPPVSVATARAARARAQNLLDDPPGVVGPGPVRYTPPAGLLRRALRFVPRRGELVIGLEPALLGPPLRRAFPGAERPRRNAEFRVTGSRVSIVPERAGVALDLPRIAAAMVTAPGRGVPLSTSPVAPAVTTARLKELGATDVVGAFTTEYPAGEPRTVNIARAAAILDGAVIPAGATFSMNRSVGERTTARGFVPAPQIANGKFEEGVGGGASQVATTLYNAAFFAGLRIISHQPHEVYISRYPMGREATISWPSPDLVFRNDWDAPIYLRVRTTATSVTVQMLSRRLGRRVETTMGEPEGRVEPKTIRNYDPTLAPGTEAVDQSMGGSGFTIRYTRKVYRGSRLLRDEAWSWSYRAVDAIVRYGPDAPASTAPTGPPASSTAPPEPTGTAPPG
ncbi:MAG: VanW family protein [Thermoleophilia bacterium]|nr:VanW family protein [Thermoleophilia bacterium]